MSASARTILVVDDVDENCEILQRRLEKAGYVVETARNGKEGLERLRRGRIDAVLLDISMPVMDGVTMLGQIQGDPCFSHTPVVMLTAAEDLDTALVCLREGAAGYLTKPFNMEQIRTQLDNCFAEGAGHQAAG